MGSDLHIKKEKYFVEVVRPTLLILWQPIKFLLPYWCWSTMKKKIDFNLFATCSQANFEKVLSILLIYIGCVPGWMFFLLGLHLNFCILYFSPVIVVISSSCWWSMIFNFWVATQGSLYGKSRWGLFLHRLKSMTLLINLVKNI